MTRQKNSLGVNVLFNLMMIPLTGGLWVFWLLVKGALR